MSRPDFRALLDAAGTPVVVHRDGEFLYVNAAFADRLGYTPDQLVGTRFEAILHPADRHVFASRMRSLRRRTKDGTTPQIIVRCVSRDGDLVLFEGGGVEVDFGGTPAVLAIARVVTGQSPIETLHDVEASFRSVMELSPDPVLVHREGITVYVNPALVKLLDCGHATSLLGRDVVHRLIHPDDRPRAAARLARMRDIPGPIAPEQFRLLRPDGRLAYVEAASMPVVFDGDWATLVLGRDISERMRLSRQLVTSERMAALGTLAAGVAHEVNNPLAYINANLELVAADVEALVRGEDVDTEELLESIAQAREGAQRVARITRCLGSFERGECTAQAVDPVRILRRTLNSIEGDLRARLEVESWSVLPPVRGDESRVAQAFACLIESATDRASDGRVRLAITADDNTVTLEADDCPTDRPGPVFLTGHAPADRAFSLSVCQAIAASLGGEVTIGRSAAGTVTRLSLPRHEEQSWDLDSAPANRSASPAPA